MAKFSINIGTVMEVEDKFSTDSYDGLRIRAELPTDKAKDIDDIPWAFPLLPKTLQSIPKNGEAVFVFMDEEGSQNASQRYFIGPIISQPQFNTFCSRKNATSLLDANLRKPLGRISNDSNTVGAFPDKEDVALVGRGAEDISLKYNTSTNESEIALRAGIRSEPTNSENENIIGNIIFNRVDPAYIQLKYKKGIASKRGNEANSLINIVANRINLISNRDDTVESNLLTEDGKLIDETNMDNLMDSLNPVPKGYDLVNLLNIMKNAILFHVHPWAGMEQCGDWQGAIEALKGFDINSILSEYVRIS